MDDLIEEMENHGFRWVSSDFQYCVGGDNIFHLTLHFYGDWEYMMSKLAYLQPLIDENFGEYTVNTYNGIHGLQFEVTISTKMTFTSNLLINSITKKLQHKDFKPKTCNLIPFKFHLG